MVLGGVDESSRESTAAGGTDLPKGAVSFKTTRGLFLVDDSRNTSDSSAAGLRFDTMASPSEFTFGSYEYHRTPVATTAIPAAMDSSVAQGDRPLGPGRDSNASVSPSNSDRSEYPAISSAIDDGAS